MSRRKTNSLFVGLLGALLIFPPVRAVSVTAADPGPGPAPRRFTFEVRDKPWTSVLEWLVDQSGLPLVSSVKPAGTFTFVPAKNSARQYTLPEIIDILNEALLAQKFVLVRRDQSLVFVAADEKIDRGVLPRVRSEDLDRHGNTELVTTVFSLPGILAEDVAPEVKKMTGPFGRVVPVRDNQLVVHDTVGNLKRIHQALRAMENGPAREGELFAYACKHIRANEAARVLRELLADPGESPRSGPPVAAPGPGRGTESARPPRVGRLQAAPYRTATDERTNTLLVSGRADLLARAREILARIDVPAQNPGGADGAILRSYDVPAGYAQAVAGTLRERYSKNAAVRITQAGDHSVLVWARPEEQLEVARQLSGLRAENRPPQERPSEGAGPRGEMFGAVAAGPGPLLRPGAVFDVYLKGGQAGENTPSFAGVRFVGYDNFADRKMLRFQRAQGANLFLIDPAEVSALRVQEVPAPGGRGRANFTPPGPEAARRGFGGGAAGGFGGGVAGPGSGRGNPLIEKLDAILEELRKLEKHWEDEERGRQGRGGPRTP